MAKSYDIAIIGGGMVGSCIAAHLAKEKLGNNIALINTTKLGLPASIAAAGLLTPFQHSEYENKEIMDFAKKSLEYFIDFYKEIKNYISVDLGFRQCGSLYVLLSRTEIGEKEKDFKELSKLQTKATFLNKRETLSVESSLSCDFIGAYHYPEEGKINNPKFLKAIQSYSEQNGIEIITSEIKDIKLNENKINEVILSSGEKLSANIFVLCNGVWANKLSEFIKLNSLLIKAIKGELIELETNDETILPEKVIFCHDGYLVTRPPTNQFEKTKIIIGSTCEEVILSKESFRTNIESINELSGVFSKLFPGIKKSFLTNYWAGLRPQTQDALPIIGKFEPFENLYCALGHYRNGILMGPLTGKIISDLIISGCTEYKIDKFSLKRFSKEKVVV